MTFRRTSSGIVTDTSGATDDEVAGTLSSRLGFRATNAQLRAVTGSDVDALMGEGRLQRQDRMLVASVPFPVGDATTHEFSTVSA